MLPEHLHPKTYWEKRCEVLEESVNLLVQIIANYSMPPAGHQALEAHMRDWGRIQSELIARHPAPIQSQEGNQP